MPLTPKPPFEIMAPVVFDIEVVVLLATKIFEYTTFAPEITPPVPVPVVMLLTVKATLLAFNVVVILRFVIVAFERTVKFPLTVKLPVIAPPAWTFNELFALANAAVMELFCVKSVAADNVAAELAAVKAPLA